MSAASVWVWFTPALGALFLYGLGQGFVKKYIAEVPPARFCLYFVFAKTFVNLWFFLSGDHPALFDSEGYRFLAVGTLAYVLDGMGWILYFQSIVRGPITIVGTLSAAYPALTVLFARAFLGESLGLGQYVGVALVIAGCLGLSYSPASPTGASKSTRSLSWVWMAGLALVLWGSAQTLVKFSYSLPHASEVSLALLNTLGGWLTLGVYGLARGRRATGSKHRPSASASRREWLRSFAPMAMMAAGDLCVIIATRHGPVSIVTPLTGAYPIVTLAFARFALREKISPLQWACIVCIVAGMFLSPGGG
jgi:drug/metabolite transporter (DMT)-like permease